MNQSIDKLANLLLARKAIHSLPANTLLTIRELNALLLVESMGTKSVKAAAAASAATNLRTASATVSAPASPPVPSLFSGIPPDGGNPKRFSLIHGDGVNRHPHQAPLSITGTATASNASGVATTCHHHNLFEPTSGARFGVTIRQLSSSSSNNKKNNQQ